MGRYYISVDGGGTKTEFAILDRTTGDITTVVDTGSNYKYADETGYTKDIGDISSSMLKEQGIDPLDVEKIFYGLSGCDSEKDYHLLFDAIRKSGIPEENVILNNDCEYGLRGCVDKAGISVVAGTGSITYAINGDLAVRDAGWGPPYSDLGSGTWIGAQFIIQAILRLDEGTEDDITRAVSAWQKEDEPLQQTLNALDIPATAALARPCLDLANAGNAECRRIADDAAAYVAEYVRRSFVKMNFNGDEIPIVTVGGVHKNEYWTNAFRKKTEELLPVKVQWIVPEKSAAISGLDYLKRTYGD